MKPRLVVFVLACLLLLSGCGPDAQSGDPRPPGEPSPTQAADTASPEVSVSAAPAPPPTPGPTEEVKELWGFPIDNTHDAFLVPTGGRLGTVLVTVEQQGEETADGLYRCTFSVWDPAGLTKPFQTFEEDARIPLSWHDLIDANFDGHMDFCYAYYSGAANATFGLYLWDEELGQFALTETFFGMDLWADEEAQTLETWSRLSAGMTSHEKYRWEDGKLVHFQSTYPDEEWKEYVTYELVDGEMVEVSRGPIFMED